jgi:hypothetical protein
VLVASTGTPHPRALVLEAGHLRVGVWRLPHDPWLPGLAAISDGDELRRLLDGLDVRPGATEHRIVSYRPSRRAVVRVRRSGVTLFVKVRPIGPRPPRPPWLADACRPGSASTPTGLVVLEVSAGRCSTPRDDPDAAPVRGGAALLDRLPSPSTGRRLAGAPPNGPACSAAFGLRRRAAPGARH